MRYFSKNFIFLYMVCCIGLFILYKSIYLNHHYHIDIVIEQNANKISSLNQSKNIKYTKIISVKRLFFPQGKILYNESVGFLGFSSNFFIKAKVKSIIKRDGLYHFIIYSDDGFRLSIDNKTVCQHLGDRSYSKTKCSYFLEKGKHNLKIDYFQGYGPLGLKAGYSFDGKKYFLIGKDSKYIIFKDTNEQK